MPVLPGATRLDTRVGYAARYIATVNWSARDASPAQTSRELLSELCLTICFASTFPVPTPHYRTVRQLLPAIATAVAIPSCCPQPSKSS